MYAAYPSMTTSYSVGLGDFGLGGDAVFAIPAGWFRTSTNAFDLWWQRQHRLPTTKERIALIEQVNQIKGGMARGEELTFEHHHEVLSFLTKNGRMPTGYPSNDVGENHVLVAKAMATVDAHVAAWEAAHKSFWDDVGDVISDVGDVLADVLPIAQTIISFVPGIGAGINAAIAAGAALARGENITDAIFEAAKNALPGGPVAAAGFDAAVAAGKAIANGDSIGDVALAATRAALPSEDAKRAFDVGLAVVQGQNLQKALVRVTASLAPAAAAVAADIFQRPELLKLPIAEMAKILNSDTATVAAADAAIRSNAALTIPIVRRPPPVLRAPKKLAPSPKLIANLAAVARKYPKATDAEVLYVAVTGDKVLAFHASKLPPKIISDMIAVARAYPQAKDAEILYIASIPAAEKKPEPTPPVVVATTPNKPAPAAPPTGARRGAYAPYPPMGHGVSGLEAPMPHGGHHGGRPFSGAVVRSGPGWWYDVPWQPRTEIVTRTETCQTWGNPVALPPEMVTAARAALGASQGRPTTVRGPDGVLYLFALENGALVARPCAALANVA